MFHEASFRQRTTFQEPMTAKTWVFTINNYTDEDVALMHTWSTEVARIAASKEVGEEGTPHIQGAVTFKTAKRLSAVKKLHSRAHWERAKAKDAFLYCVKEGSEVIVQTGGGQGTRSDLLDAKAMVDGGASVRELWEAHFPVMARYSRAVLEYKNIVEAAGAESEVIRTGWKRDPIEAVKVKAHVFIGGTGLGKTEWALAHFERPLLVSHIDELKKLETGEYDGIVFDDMDFNHWPRSAVIHLVDYAKARAINVKHSTATIPKGMPRIFTCNVYPFPMDTAGAIERRVEQELILEPLFEVPAAE